MFLLLGFWDIPVSSYYVEFFAIGLLGFGLCRFRRWFIVPILGLIGYLTATEISRMASSSVAPNLDSWFALQVYFAILCSIILAYAGFVTGRRKARSK